MKCTTTISRRNRLITTGKRILFIATILVVNGSASSQPIEPFQKKFGGADYDALWKVANHPNGNFIGVGNTLTVGQGDRDILITEFDLDGAILNSWTIGTSRYESTPEILCLANGDLIVLYRTLYEAGSSIDNAILARLTLSGTIVWTKQFGDAETEVLPEELILTSDGDLLFAGLIRHANDNLNERGILVKLNINGSVLFRKEWDASTDHDSFDEIAEVPGGYLVSGYTDVMDPSSTWEKPLLAKFDTNGNLIWSNYYDDGSYVNANNISLLSNPDGTAIVAFNILGSNSTSSEDQDIMVLKMDSDGSQLWATRVAGPDADDIDHMLFTNSGQIMVVGNLEGIGFGGANGLVFTITQGGELMKAYTFGKDGNEEIGDAISFTQNSCQGYMLVGRSSSFNLDGSADAWIIKTDDNLGSFDDCYTHSIPLSEQPSAFQSSSIGTVDDWDVSSNPDQIFESVNFTSTSVGCGPQVASNCVVSIENHKELVPRFSLAPNPNSGQFIVQMDTPSFVSKYMVHDLTGRKIMEVEYQKSLMDRLDIALPSTSKGLYLLSVRFANGTSTTKRVLVQ